MIAGEQPAVKPAYDTGQGSQERFGAPGFSLLVQPLVLLLGLGIPARNRRFRRSRDEKPKDDRHSPA